MEASEFKDRWTAREGGAERANFPLFISEFCDVIGVPRPEPAGADRRFNDYTYERTVSRRDVNGALITRRIDLYKRDCFILEAKQSRLPGGKKALPIACGGHVRLNDLPRSRTWDSTMRNARMQAEQCVACLDPDHNPPPFLIICDVGNVFEIYADFSGTGRAYTHFPDRNSYRIPIERLIDGDVRTFFRKIWTDPYGLDPARERARVTRAIAGELASVSRSLEAHHHPEDVALFLLRCIFCMFAESVDLLPRGKFTQLLEECSRSPQTLVPLLGELWRKMDTVERSDRFFSYFCCDVRHFNGNLYRNARVLPLSKDEIAKLVQAARHNWIDVDPAIFGTLLEQALNPDERRRLGAHYTPRVYVQRLVEATILDVLRNDWSGVVKQAEDAKERGDERNAIAIVRAFHRRLCSVRVLDPACGTGNFLYVSLELMKKLEGETLELLAQLGDTELLGLEDETVDPRQFLGLELNPRAAAIAELVIWIGFLQQHYRTRSGHPREPILRAFSNINGGQRLGFDALITWDGAPATTISVQEGERVESYPNPRQVEWPEAEFIVGNPPFLGGKDIRSRLGNAYAEALWNAHPQMNESADLVMYWWDHAAELLTRKGTKLRRFGFVTTNSISQVFQRRTIERHLKARNPVSIIMAIPDHPWTKATPDSASVRIAMTVVEAGKREGRLLHIATEGSLESETPVIAFRELRGIINANLTCGPDVGSAVKLEASRGLCSRGVVLHGAGFQVDESEASRLGLGRVPGLERRLRPYRNGRDLSDKPRERLVIDLFGLGCEEVRTRFPEVYQHLLEHVKPDRDRNTRDYRRENWWLFGENVPDARKSWAGLTRYIATVETAKHRIFQFLDASILPDNKIVCIALDDSAYLAILHSRAHEAWYLANSAMLGVYDREAVYVKTRCFDPFPFPEVSPALRQQLATAGEELDRLRKRVLCEHPDLTMTGLYNVLEKIKRGKSLTPREADVKQRGLVLILQELHQTIDDLTADAYSWPRDLTAEQIVERLVRLNLERAREEEEGRVSWLRPDYQAPRFGRQESQRNRELDFVPAIISIDRGKPSFPKDRPSQLLATEAVVQAATVPMDAAAVARSFRNGGRKIEPRVAQILLNLAIYGHLHVLPDGRFVGRAGAPFNQLAA